MTYDHRSRKARELADVAFDLTDNERLAYLLRCCTDDLVLLENARALYAARVAAASLDLPNDDRSRFIARYAECDSSLESMIIAKTLETTAFTPSTVLNPQTAWKKPESGDCVGGRFRLIAHAASGGLGQVWKATDDKTDGHLVAVKFLHDRWDVHRAAWFDRERELLAAIRHPHVVKYIHDGVDLSVGGPYLATEWVDGTTLTRHVSEYATLTERVTLIRDVSLALQVIHDHGYIHRDIKPDNIMIRSDGRVCIIDLGLARPYVVDIGQHLTATHMVVGTRPYAAPEQWVGGQLVGFQADIHALGITLREVLNLGSQASAAAAQHRRHPVDTRLLSIVQCATAPNAEDRYQTAQAFAFDLNSWLSDHAESDGGVLSHGFAPPEVQFRQRKLIADAVRSKRQRSVAIAACTLIGVLLTVSTGALINSRQQTRRATSANLAAKDAVDLLVEAVSPQSSWEALQERRGPEERDAVLRLESLLTGTYALSTVSRQDIMSAVATKAFVNGDGVTSERLFRRLLDSLGGMSAKPTWHKAYALLGLGQSLASRGQYEDAVPHLRAALDIMPQLAEHRPLERAGILHSLGISLFESEKRAEAIKVLSDAHEAFAAGGSRGRVGLLTVKLSQAEIALRYGTTDQALLTNYKGALEELERGLVDRSSEIANARYVYAHALKNLRRYGDAEVEADRVVTSVECIYGGRDLQLASVLVFRSIVRRSAGKWDDAIADSQRAIYIADNHEPKESAASQIRALARRAEAAVYTVKANQLMDEAHRNGKLGDDVQVNGYRMRSVELYGAALEILRSTNDVHGFEYSECSGGFGVALSNAGQHARADEVLRETEALRRKLSGWSEAEEQQGIECPETVRQIQFVRAKNLIMSAKNREQEALQILRKLADGAKRSEGRWVDAQDIIRELVRLLRKMGESNEADMWDDWLGEMPS